ncbi:MAG: GIY-YIG nuclease family protein [Candidatus Doudnabacteria bacterium]|nr:GIY-YIG nuclease family protein [Candidatus Doudnabacteria bacterium]
MYQVYILISLKDSHTYVGYAKDAKFRLKDHNLGRVNATRMRRPLEIIYIENVETLRYAKQRELYWKSGGGRRKLKQYFEKGFPPIEDGRGSPK